MIDADALNRSSATPRQMGNSFFGILGGEPFMHPQLLDMLAAHPDCYFQIFTNGQLITDEIARELRALGNVTPLISIEGTEVVSDERRGRLERAEQDAAGLEAAAHRLITGVATSVCQTNIDDWSRSRGCDRLIDDGRALRLVPHLPPGRARTRSPSSR